MIEIMINRLIVSLYNIMEYILQRSEKKGKKWNITTLRGKSIHIGARGYQDYTEHKDKERKLRYLKRHFKRENWGPSGKETAGFWSRWLLWNKPSMSESIDNIEKRFGVRIIVK